MDIHEIIAANKLVEDLRKEIRDEEMNHYSSGTGGSIDGFNIWITGAAYSKDRSLGVADDHIIVYARVYVNGKLLKFNQHLTEREKTEDIVKEIGEFVIQKVAKEVAKELIGSDNFQDFLKLIK